MDHHHVGAGHLALVTADVGGVQDVLGGDVVGAGVGGRVLHGLGGEDLLQEAGAHHQVEHLGVGLAAGEGDAQGGGQSGISQKDGVHLVHRVVVHVVASGHVAALLIESHVGQVLLHADDLALQVGPEGELAVAGMAVDRDDVDALLAGLHLGDRDQEPLAAVHLAGIQEHVSVEGQVPIPVLLGGGGDGVGGVGLRVAIILQLQVAQVVVDQLGVLGVVGGIHLLDVDGVALLHLGIDLQVGVQGVHGHIVVGDVALEAPVGLPVVEAIGVVPVRIGHFVLLPHGPAGRLRIHTVGSKLAGAGLAPHDLEVVALLGVGSPQVEELGLVHPLDVDDVGALARACISGGRHDVDEEDAVVPVIVGQRDGDVGRDAVGGIRSGGIVHQVVGVVHAVVGDHHAVGVGDGHGGHVDGDELVADGHLGQVVESILGEADEAGVRGVHIQVAGGGLVERAQPADIAGQGGRGGLIVGRAAVEDHIQSVTVTVGPLAPDHPDVVVGGLAVGLAGDGHLEQGLEVLGQEVVAAEEEFLPEAGLLAVQRTVEGAVGGLAGAGGHPGKGDILVLPVKADTQPHAVVVVVQDHLVAGPHLLVVHHGIAVIVQTQVVVRGIGRVLQVDQVPLIGIGHIGIVGTGLGLVGHQVVQSDLGDVVGGAFHVDGVGPLVELAAVVEVMDGDHHVEVADIPVDGLRNGLGLVDRVTVLVEHGVAVIVLLGHRVTIGILLDLLDGLNGVVAGEQVLTEDSLEVAHGRGGAGGVGENGTGTEAIRAHAGVQLADAGGVLAEVLHLDGGAEGIQDLGVGVVVELGDLHGDLGTVLLVFASGPDGELILALNHLAGVVPDGRVEGLVQVGAVLHAQVGEDGTVGVVDRQVVLVDQLVAAFGEAGHTEGDGGTGTLLHHLLELAVHQLLHRREADLHEALALGHGDAVALRVEDLQVVARGHGLGADPEFLLLGGGHIVELVGHEDREDVAVVPDGGRALGQEDTGHAEERAIDVRGGAIGVRDLDGIRRAVHDGLAILVPDVVAVAVDPVLVLVLGTVVVKGVDDVGLDEHAVRVEDLDVKPVLVGVHGHAGDGLVEGLGIVPLVALVGIGLVHQDEGALAALHIVLEALVGGVACGQVGAVDHHVLARAGIQTVDILVRRDGGGILGHVADHLVVALLDRADHLGVPGDVGGYHVLVAQGAGHGGQATAVPLGLPAVDGDFAGGHVLAVLVLPDLGDDTDLHLHGDVAVHVHLHGALVTGTVEVIGGIHRTGGQAHLDILEPLVAHHVVALHEGDGVTLVNIPDGILHHDEDHVGGFQEVVVDIGLGMEGHTHDAGRVGLQVGEGHAGGQVGVIVEHPRGEASGGVDHLVDGGGLGELRAVGGIELQPSSAGHGDDQVAEVHADAGFGQTVDDQGVHILVVGHTVGTLIVDKDVVDAVAHGQVGHMKPGDGLLRHHGGQGRGDLGAGHTLDDAVLTQDLLGVGGDIQLGHVPGHGHVILLVVLLEGGGHGALADRNLLQGNGLIVLGQTDDVDDDPVPGIAGRTVGIQALGLDLHHILHALAEVDVHGILLVGVLLAILVIVVLRVAALQVGTGHRSVGIHQNAVDPQAGGVLGHGADIHPVDLVLHHQIVEPDVGGERKIQVLELGPDTGAVIDGGKAGQAGGGDERLGVVLIGGLGTHTVDDHGVELALARAALGGVLDLHHDHVVAHQEVVDLAGIVGGQGVVVDRDGMAAILQHAAVLTQNLEGGIHEHLDAGDLVGHLDEVIVEVRVEVGRHLVGHVLQVGDLQEGALPDIGDGALVGGIHMDGEQVLLGGDHLSHPVASGAGGVFDPVAVHIQLVGLARHLGDEEDLIGGAGLQIGELVGVVGQSVHLLQGHGCALDPVLGNHHLHGTSGRLLRPLSGRQVENGFTVDSPHQILVADVHEVVDPIVIPDRRQTSHRDGHDGARLAVGGPVHDMAHGDDVGRVVPEPEGIVLQVLIAPVELHNVHVAGVLGRGAIVLLGRHGHGDQVLAPEEPEDLRLVAAQGGRATLEEVPAAGGADPDVLDVVVVGRLGQEADSLLGRGHGHEVGVDLGVEGRNCGLAELQVFQQAAHLVRRAAVGILVNYIGGIAVDSQGGVAALFGMAAVIVPGQQLQHVPVVVLGQDQLDALPELLDRNRSRHGLAGGVEVVQVVEVILVALAGRCVSVSHISEQLHLVAARHHRIEVVIGGMLIHLTDDLNALVGGVLQGGIQLHLLEDGRLKAFVPIDVGEGSLVEEDVDLVGGGVVAGRTAVVVEHGDLHRVALAGLQARRQVDVRLVDLETHVGNGKAGDIIVYIVPGGIPDTVSDDVITGGLVLGTDRIGHGDQGDPAVGVLLQAASVHVHVVIGELGVKHGREVTPQAMVSPIPVVDQLDVLEPGYLVGGPVVDVNVVVPDVALVGRDDLDPQAVLVARTQDHILQRLAGIQGVICIGEVVDGPDDAVTLVGQDDVDGGTINRVDLGEVDHAGAVGHIHMVSGRGGTVGIGHKVGNQIQHRIGRGVPDGLQLS